MCNKNLVTSQKMTQTDESIPCVIPLEAGHALLPCSREKRSRRGANLLRNKNCLDAFEPILAARPLRHCAVVGSADLFRWYPMGDRINAAGSVWRVNHAPARGFDALVGNRTDVRIMNHVWSDVQTGALRPKWGEFAGIGPEFAAYKSMCRDNMCIALSKSPFMLSFHEDAFRAMTACHATTPSTGMMVVAAALRACRGVVHLYGFFPDCCDAQTMYPGINYKYYHTRASRWVCCAKGREDMHAEYASYVRHPRLRVWNTETRIASPNMPTCAVVGSAWTSRRFGAQIDSADVVYRTNHAPTRGYESIVGTRTDVRSIGDDTITHHAVSMADCARGTQCILIRKYADLKRYSNASVRLASRHPSVLLASVNFTRYIISFKSQFTRKPWMRIKVSGGMATTLYAMQRCSRVDVYLTETDDRASCCRTGRPYRYYGNAMRAKCCEISRESSDESSAWRELVSRGVAVHEA